MMRKWIHILSVLVTLSTAGCGGGFAPQFDPTVPADQQQLLQNDFQFLHSSNLVPSSAQDLQIIDISDLQASTMEAWLQVRIHLIVGEGFNAQSQVTETQLPIGELPQTISDQGVASSSLQVETLMQNLGAMLFLQGISQQSLYTLNTPEGSMPVNSPRVGVVQVGQGMFDGTNSIPGTPMTSHANSMLRLATIFHEARHADGNGAYAAFPHAICPSGDYAGQYACETNLNGPYSVQSVLLTDFANNCASCTANEQQGLLLMEADLASRLLPGAAFQNDAPEVLN